MPDNKELHAMLASMERKVRVLVGAYSEVRQERDLLRNENKQLKSIISEKDTQIAGFQNQIKISKIVNHVSGNENPPAELKQKIDDYIKEIDRCILHLSR